MDHLDGGLSISSVCFLIYDSLVGFYLFPC